MKIHFLSDLHLEFGKMPRVYAAPADADVVVLAGDIGTGRSGMAWAMQTYPEIPVIYVSGNHELYNRSMSLYQELEAKAATMRNIHFLEMKSVRIDGWKFVGATMWTDMELHGDPVKSGIACKFGMNDFRTIEGMGIGMWLDRNRMAREYILRELEERIPTVVITHHAPSELSIPSRFGGDELNAAFASKFLETIPEDIRPAVWIHGHTHDSFDYHVGNTRVLCNPRGYVGHEVNPLFDINKVIEV